MECPFHMNCLVLGNRDWYEGACLHHSKGTLSVYCIAQRWEKELGTLVIYTNLARKRGQMDKNKYTNWATKDAQGKRYPGVE